MFASRSMFSGVYAALLDWTNKAGIVKLQIEDTLRHVAALNHSTIPFRLHIVSQVHLAQCSNHNRINLICPRNLQYFASMQPIPCNCRQLSLLWSMRRSIQTISPHCCRLMQTICIARWGSPHRRFNCILLAYFGSMHMLDQNFLAHQFYLN